jgi:hypothetical protein
LSQVFQLILGTLLLFLIIVKQATHWRTSRFSTALGIVLPGGVLEHYHASLHGMVHLICGCVERRSASSGVEHPSRGLRPTGDPTIANQHERTRAIQHNPQEDRTAPQAAARPPATDFMRLARSGYSVLRP